MYRREHWLKVLPEYFEDLLSGKKRFAVRKDDRGYQVGDYLWVREWDGTQYTGRSLPMVQIKYIFRGCPEYGLMPGYCILEF